MSASKKFVLMGVVIIGVAGVWAYRFWNDPHRQFEAARQAMRAGDVETVRKTMEVLKDYPLFNAHRHFLRGSLLLRDGAMDEAYQEFGFCIEHPDLEVDATVLAGQALYQARRAGNAKVLWDRALKLDPNCLDAHRWLGVLCYDIGAMDHALNHFKKVSELAPKDARPDRMMGMIHWMYDRPQDAVNHYRESLRRSTDQPDLETILMELAECEAKVRDYPAALETLAKCKTRSVRHRTLEADSRFSLGEYDRAMQLLDEALAEAPDDYLARLAKGKILLAQQKPQEAADALKAAIERRAVDDDAHAQLATALRILGKDEEAKHHEEESARLRDLWIQNRDYHTKAIAEPNNAELRFKMGTLSKELDRPDLARAWFQAAIAINPEYDEALKELDALTPNEEVSTQP